MQSDEQVARRLQDQENAGLRSPRATQPQAGPMYGQPGGYGGGYAQPPSGYAQPPSGYVQPPSGGYAQPIQQPHAHIIPISGYGPSGVSADPTQMELLGLARATRWFAVIDIILCILYAFSGFGWIALVAMIGPILGYMGGKQYRKNLVIFYMFFLILLIAFRILGLVFFYDTVAGLVLSILMIVIELYILRLVWRFHHMLRRLSQQEIDQARMMNSLVVRPFLW
jgi:hypothetical protein